MMADIDKEVAATVLFDEVHSARLAGEPPPRRCHDTRTRRAPRVAAQFVEMATPKMQSRDTREEIMKARRRLPPLPRREGPSLLTARAAVTQVFALFDDDASGHITFRNLKRVATELGENLTDEELQEMIDEADRDGDGMINDEEFYRVMKKRGDNPLDDLSSDEDDF